MSTARPFPTVGRRRRVAVSAVAALILGLLPLTALDAAHTANTTERFAGEDRFDTARLVAGAPEFDNADTVVIARAHDFADALAGALIAGQRRAPLLLTDEEDLSAPTVQAIEDIAPASALILGGTGAVGEDVEKQLAAFDSIDDVERIGGDDRFHTARLIAERVAADFTALQGFGTASGFADDDDEQRVTAVLATGRDFPDALASGPLAAGGLLPILLTESTSLPTATREALQDGELGIEQVLIVGGSEAVSQDVQRAVAELELPTRRIAGSGRTETAADMARFTQQELFTPNSEADALAVTNGRGFPDALALAPLAALRRAPVVITHTPDDLGQAARVFLTDNCAGGGAPDAPVTIAGGEVAVSGSVEADIKDAVVCAEFVPAGRLRVSPTTAETPVGQELAITASGTNATGDPAYRAEVIFEVFREVVTPEQSLPEDARIYRDGSRLFRKVQATTLVADVEGTATFGYRNDDVAEDRIVVCTPPQKEDAPACTDELGNPRSDEGYANVVVENRWVASGDGS